MMIWIWLMGCTGVSDDTGASQDEAIDPLSWSVMEEGPYSVGYQSWELRFESVIDGTERVIDVHAWYPTLDTTGEAVAYLGFYADTESLGDATPAPSAYADGYPVHIYSHGNTMFGGDASHLMRYFASHGWLALAPDHTDNMITDSQDGSIPTSVYIHRPQDLSETLDLIASLPTDDPLSGANTDAVLVNGHSRGCDDVWMTMGASVDAESLAAACPNFDEGTCSDAEMAAFLSGELSDDRMMAGITMAGTINRGYHGDAGHLDVRGPVMLMSGSNDPGHAVSESWDGLAGIERSLVDIEGACHGSFNMGLCDTIDKETGYAIVRTYALAFGRQRILDDTDETVNGIMAGAISVAEEASIRLGD